LGGLGAGGAVAALTALPSPAGATTPATGVPAYAQSAANIFEPATSVYNWKAANTRRHRAGLAQAQAGAAASEVFVGDSLTAGCLNVYTGTFDRPHAWPMIYRDTLAGLGIPVNGTGIVRVIDYIYADARISWSGPWVNNTTTGCVSSAGATLTFTTDKPGTAVGVLFQRTPGSGGFSVSVNGARSGAGYRSVVGGGSGWARVDLSGVDGIVAGSTVTVTTTSAAMVVLGGFEVYTPDSGVSLHNVAQSGSGATLPTKKGWSTTSDASQNLSIWSCLSWSPYLQTPSTVHIAMGGNDVLNNATDDAITAALSRIRAGFPNSDCILYLEPRPATALVGRWSSFGAAMYQLADTLDVALFDINDRLGGYPTETTTAMVGDTFGHLSRAGYADWGRSVAMTAAR
jgi:lysophospholipase L1-like esterase